MYAVIMAGGRGTRFWPLSREKKPKHLLSITGSQTVIQKTIERIRPLIPQDNMYIVTGESHCDEIIRQCSLVPEKNIVAEPVGRNTAPCIGLAALYIKRRDPEAVMVVLPADHMITEEDRFREALMTAGEMAQRGNHLITIGVEPTEPATGYGYIEQGDILASIGGNDIFRVASFREKPDLQQASEFVDSGRFFWNSGIFVWKASTILSAIQNLLPNLYQGLETIEKSLSTEKEKEVIREVYEKTDPISIDYGVMERVQGTLLIKGSFGWNDIGDWNALYDIFERNQMGNAVKGSVIAVDASNSLVYSPNKLVALVGIQDLIVVETEDSLLICHKGRSQDIKKVVEILEKENMKEYL
ncbi:MAG: mannose-1-phosphate guanylyltransferase [Deltaproteobacteria bacterium]|nr:mannose-1-phosphate guanylyltransferase [Deltaproteobacteria bacterium]